MRRQSFSYAPSTKFYLDDKSKGKPWITRIPFPVHVVERVETYDRISRNRFVTRYAYHHGYFDGIEREFRGFGMVEQWDTEEIRRCRSSEAIFRERYQLGCSVTCTSRSYQDLVSYRCIPRSGSQSHASLRVLWMDTTEGSITASLHGEDDDAEAEKRLLDDTILPDSLTTEEEREACRALKGSMLRQEVYALDGTAKETASLHSHEQNFTISSLQPQAENRHAVFFTHAREAISYHYERNPK